MVLIAPLVGAAVFLSGFAAALPTSYDSSSNSNSNSNYGSSSSDSNSNSNYGSSNSNSNYGSSSSNSNYGSSDSNSNYGSSNSNSNYGSSNNYGGNSNNYQSSSSSSDNNNYETSSTDNSNYYQTSSTDNSNNYQTSTSSTYNSYQTPSYGSGSSNYWGGSGYEDCVNQCMAQFGNGGSSNSGNSGSNMGGYYQATATSGSMGSTGSGATHTVIVAPSQGVFRFVPFATNASVGDTIEFQWGANNHTVTKSSALLPCNKSSDAPIFASGEHNATFVFTQVVNDTNPIFYYCGTPGHCEKGMFGVINPAMATPGAPMSVGGMMQSMAANDSELATWAAVSTNATANNAQAGQWGDNFDMSAIPDWAQSSFAANVMYTRTLIGMNPDIYSTGAVDLSSVASTPLMLPVDISALDASTAPAATTGDAAATPAAAAATDPATTSAPAKTGGASALASPKLFVAGAVVLATIFAL